jgi:cold shock CspA family protein
MAHLGSGVMRSNVAGRVTAFDVDEGLGEVTATDGMTYPFHCTSIADGTRDIRVDTDVHFDVVAGHHGRWEAANLVHP